MKTQILIVALGTFASMASFATEVSRYCEQQTGLPQCGTVAPGNHCCVDQATVPNVRCFRPYVAMTGSDGNWHCVFAPTLGGH